MEGELYAPLPRKLNVPFSGHEALIQATFDMSEFQTLI